MYFAFLIFQPSGKITVGTPAILKEKDRLCENCNCVHDIEICPLCGSFIGIGYGLMGGGMGEYKFCEDDGCPWFYKILDPFEKCTEAVN